MSVTVSQLIGRLTNLIADDRALHNLSVKGEVINFKLTSKGHIFFKLTEGDVGINAVIFAGVARRLAFLPQDGMNVVATGNVEVYRVNGECRLIVSAIQQDEGVGEAMQQLEQLKARLRAEGLFSQRRPLPYPPSSICFVTSETGAVIKDMTNILERRYPFVRAILVPVSVQGADAPASIARGIEKAQTSGCDLIIFGRGGGSPEELSAFSSEIVARAVYASRIPTISAVGHDIDHPISDDVADAYAPTPSAAIEIAVPDIKEYMADISELHDRIRSMALNRLTEAKARLEAAEKLLSYHKPSNLLEAQSRRISDLYALIQKDFTSLISRKESGLAAAAELLSAFDPLNTLRRGYSMTYKDGSLISSVSSVAKGEKITVKLSDGDLEAVVENISPSSKE